MFRGGKQDGSGWSGDWGGQADTGGAEDADEFDEDEEEGGECDLYTVDEQTCE